MANNQPNQSESQADSLRKCRVPGPPRSPRLKSNKEQVRFSKIWLLVLLSKTEPTRVCSTKRKMSESGKADNKPHGMWHSHNGRCPFRFFHDLQLILHNSEEIEFQRIYLAMLSEISEL